MANALYHAGELVYIIDISAKKIFEIKIINVYQKDGHFLYDYRKSSSGSVAQIKENGIYPTLIAAQDKIDILINNIKNNPVSYA